MENTLIDGRYLLLTEIGSGGEARVFRARDQSTGSEVALRLARRPQAPSTPSNPPPYHESWVRLIAFGSNSQFGPYHVFELLEGLTLSQTIHSAPLHPLDWHAFVEQSLNAVEALHAAGWLHGDINADNFLQTDLGWKLLELPFVRLTPPAGRSALFGSIHTFAPEQFKGAPPGIPTEVHALGCLYYYAASGAYPHPGKNSAEVAISCLRFPPRPLHEIVPSLPAPWSDCVMQMIAHEIEDRLPSLAAARQLLGVA